MAARFRLSIFCLVWIFLAIPAWAYDTYYVAKTGSDSNTCTQAKSTSTPKLTVNGGRGCLASGDTLLIRAGTYVEQAFGGAGYTIPAGVDDSNHTIIAGYPLENVILQLSYRNASNQQLQINVNYLTVKDLTLDVSSGGSNGIYINSGLNHILIDNLEIKNAPQNGIQISSSKSSYVTVQNCRIHNNGGTNQLNHGIYFVCDYGLVQDNDLYSNAGAGMQVWQTSGGANNNVIRRNKFHGNYKGFPIQGSNNQVYNNLIYGEGQYGISIRLGPNYIYNNTIYNISSPADGILINSTGTGTEIRNNILYSVITAVNDGGTGTIKSNNIEKTPDPKFTNAASADFTLLAGSPAINTGYCLNNSSDCTPVYSSDLITIDYAGTLRATTTSGTGSAFDIGAFEFASPPASLSLTYPNASGITWQNGNTYTITWTSNGNPGNLDIDLSLDGKATWPTSISSNTADDGNENWIVSGSNSSNCYIRIKDHATGLVIGYSDAPFTIQSSVTASITVTSPATGKVLHPGRTSPITWTAVGVSGNVKIELSLNGGTTYPVIISASTPWDFVDYSWTIPILTASSNCKIKVTSLTDTNIYGITGAFRLAGKYR